MAQIIFNSTGAGKREIRHHLQKKITTVGSDEAHDIRLQENGKTTSGARFTIVRTETGFDLMPGVSKIRVNGQPLKRITRLGSCDRIEGDDFVGVFLDSDAPIQQDRNPSSDALKSLLGLTTELQSSGSVHSALLSILDLITDLSGAEAAYLLSDLGGPGWEVVASRDRSQSTRKEIFSNTILNEALKRREIIFIENIIGHPWADNASIIEARIFSAVCVPLIVQDRILGAVFLVTRSSGKSIRKESLSDLSLFATQAALLLGIGAQLRDTRRENIRLRAPGAPPNEEGRKSSLSFANGSPMAGIVSKIAKLAVTPLPVLIHGETGTGKELVARELHLQSARAAKPFIAVNCAAIPATLLESTLFGHEKGAFTGAVRAQAGKFQQASGGTLFLDEIGDLPLELQSKLLRAIQEKMVEPLGSSNPVAVDLRLVCASHMDIDAAVRAGRFRQDLYYRISGAVIEIPALRDRKQDIVVLAEEFLQEHGLDKEFSEEARRKLTTHSWPGNVRELHQSVTRAAFLSEGRIVNAEDIEWIGGAGWLPQGMLEAQVMRLEEAQSAFTRDYVNRALERNQGRRSEAAQALGISERTLYRILSVENAHPPDRTGRNP